jgi:hypothetical protein
MEVLDFRNSIEHNLTVRKDLQPQRVNVRARQSQQLEPSAKDLELERIYMQSLEISSPQNTRYSPRKTTASSWQNSRKNTSPKSRPPRYE